MSTKKMLRDLANALHEEGYALMGHTTNGHIKVRVRNAAGKERMFVMSCSPTDRAITVRNVVRDVRTYLGGSS